MDKIFSLFTMLLLCGNIALAREYHVSVNGSDTADGSASQPLRTINAAARIALAGDTVTVHHGTYREWVNPHNGGEREGKRILYRVAEGEKAEIKGSEIVTGWKRDKKAPGVWRVDLPNSFFGDYNPFADRLYGDWLWSDKVHHTADVYLNEVSLYETFSRDKVFAPDTLRTIRDPQGSTKVWFAEVGPDHTTVYANFGDSGPNRELVEIAIRPTCFYPTRQGLDFITLRGFHISQAATQWAAPTAEQIGMVATNWCSNWIIEDNVIRNSRANGITLGKERSTGHNLECNDRRLDGTAHYIEVIFNALRKGWNKDNVGSHIVRNNVISDCEQTGICGSMGAAFSDIYGNHIYNILVKQQFGGAEMAGIKLHGAIDTHIHHNRIHRNGHYGIWLDWMAQGSHVEANLLYDNAVHDLFIEVSHGPYMVDNNIFLSPLSLQENTDGGAYVNNLFAGYINRLDDQRYTPYHLAHSTGVKGIHTITEGDHRFFNNLFVGGRDTTLTYGTAVFDVSKRPMVVTDNLYLNGAKPMKNNEIRPMTESADPGLAIIETPDGEVYLTSRIPLSRLNSYRGREVDESRTGITQLSGLPFENADTSPYRPATDFFGHHRSATPVVGPVESLPADTRIRLWPIR